MIRQILLHHWCIVCNFFKNYFIFSIERGVEAWCPELEAGAVHAAGFSWAKCFEETLKSYERALNLG